MTNVKKVCSSHNNVICHHLDDGSLIANSLPVKFCPICGESAAKYTILGRGDTLKPEDDEAEIIAKYNALRQIRRDNKKSIVRTDDGKFLTSVVYTDRKFAKRIIDYFSPQFNKDDTFIDPCAGKNAFYSNLPQPRTRCEIQDNKDFLAEKNKYNWAFCNFPCADLYIQHWPSTH